MNINSKLMRSMLCFALSSGMFLATLWAQDEGVYIPVEGEKNINIYLTSPAPNSQDRELKVLVGGHPEVLLTPDHVTLTTANQPQTVSVRGIMPSPFPDATRIWASNEDGTEIHEKFLTVFGVGWMEIPSAVGYCGKYIKSWSGDVEISLEPFDVPDIGMLSVWIGEEQLRNQALDVGGGVYAIPKDELKIEHVDKYVRTDWTVGGQTHSAESYDAFHFSTLYKVDITPDVISKCAATAGTVTFGLTGDNIPPVDWSIAPNTATIADNGTVSYFATPEIYTITATAKNEPGCSDTATLNAVKIEYALVTS